jgi:hypothetical protein
VQPVGRTAFGVIQVTGETAHELVLVLGDGRELVFPGSDHVRIEVIVELDDPLGDLGDSVTGRALEVGQEEEEVGPDGAQGVIVRSIL